MEEKPYNCLYSFIVIWWEEVLVKNSNKEIVSDQISFLESLVIFSHFWDIFPHFLYQWIYIFIRSSLYHANLHFNLVTERLKHSSLPVLTWFTFCGKIVKSTGVGEGNDTPLQYSCLENPMDGGAWWAAVHGVATSQTRLSDFTFTFHFHALEEEMATHSRILAWRIPGTGEPGGLPSMGSHRVGHDWSDWSDLAANSSKYNS